MRVAPQRGLYTRGARELWSGLSKLATERAAFDAYRPAFQRFLSRFDRPLSDPVLQAGVDAWRKRMDLYAAYTPLGSCKHFNRLAGRARQFAENVRADYLAGDIYNKMVRFAENEKRKAGRRHWGSRYDAALSAARTQHEALGGNVGYATLFALALAARLTAGYFRRRPLVRGRDTCRDGHHRERAGRAPLRGGRDGGRSRGRRGVCHPDVEFQSVLGLTGRAYIGHDGIREYFDDAESAWSGTSRSSRSPKPRTGAWRS